MNRFIAAQIGARRGYAVPSILEEVGMLEAFYTDLCADVGLGAILANWCPQFLQHGTVKNFLGRRLPLNLHDKTYTFPIPTLRYLWRKQLAKNNEQKAAEAMSLLNEELGNAMVRKGFGEATHLFTMFGEATPLLREAKKQGLVTVTEIFVILDAYYIIKAEREKLPELEPINPEEEALVTEAFNWLKEVLSLSDWIIAPSEAVIKDLIINFNFSRERCFLIPYGVNSSWLNLENHPQKGRILFVGTAEMRKGIHILGMAAQKLKRRNYEFHVAGGVTETICCHPLTENLNFLGRVPRTEIQNEYTQADVFVLPSFAEGSAEVTYEALAAGIPVITTSASGSVVRDGIDGFIVPEGDAVALTDKIEELIENRLLRESMAKEAKNRAKDYTWEKYSQRLLSVFQSI